MQRALALLLVLLAVALAGCGALSGGEPTRNALDVNGTTPLHGIEFDAENDRMPAGEDVYDAHLASLDDASYTVLYESVTRINGSVANDNRWTLEYGTDHSRYHHVTKVGGQMRNGTYEIYSNGTHVWRKTTRENETTVEFVTDSAGTSASSASRRAQIPQSFLQSALYQLEDPAVSELTPASAASSRYRITTDDLAGIDDGNGSLSLEITVTEDGRVTRLEYDVERPGPDGGRLARSVTLRYLKVNATSVDRPDWARKTLENGPGEPAATGTTTGNETTTGNAVATPNDTTTGDAAVLADRIGSNPPTAAITPVFVIHEGRRSVATAPRR